ncbi:MAG TPA: DUF255 domain-containing protein, partial [Chroococcales cyanobacterium]
MKVSRSRSSAPAATLLTALMLATIAGGALAFSGSDGQTPSDARSQSESRSSTEAKSKIEWRPFNDQLFTEAKRNHKLVLLDLEAVWCHWCHVMDEETYSDAAIAKYLNEHFLA